MAFQKWPAEKDPDAIRDYGRDWSSDIGDQTISSSVWTVVEGAVIIDAQSHDDKSATVRLSGGTAGETCLLLNHIVLSDGQEDERTTSLKIAEL
jgi:hypothetical protein